jgi:hypothetical protein
MSILWEKTHFFTFARYSTDRFCYVVYNSPYFNGFNNCTFWSIIVVITLGKCAHRTPLGVRERHTCIGLMKSKKIYMKTPFLQLNLSSVEHVWVEYHVAESTVLLLSSFTTPLSYSPTPQLFYFSVFPHFFSTFLLYLPYSSTSLSSYFLTF